MTIKRMDHVSVVVVDLADAIAFFTALGMALEGETRSRVLGWTASAGSQAFGSTSL